MKQVIATVVSNRKIVTGVPRPKARSSLGNWITWLECSETAKEARPGQFVMVRCGGECILRRPLSVHEVSNEGIALLFDVWEDGKGMNWLSQRRTGDTVELLAPLGNGFSVLPSSKNLLLVAGGIGIAPLCFLAQQSLNQGCLVTLLYGTRTKHRYPEHFLPPNLKLVSATEDGTVGHKGKVADLLSEYIDWADQIFACGPLPMYKTMAQMPELKNKPVQVSLEVRMGCGFGACYGCTVKTKRGLKQVCKDGPVFDLDDVLWDEIA